MTANKAWSILKKCWMFYAMGFAAILGIKYYYSNAGCGDLQWILAPTAWWAGFLGGIPFVYQSNAGYVSHSYEFIIAPSCSGVQFMMVTMATLLFSFAHRMRTRKRALLWVALSLGGSYLLTVFVNGIRIVLSIYLPLLLKPERNMEWLTPARLHTTIGIAVYFTFLSAAYQGADCISSKINGNPLEKPDRCPLTSADP